MAEGIETIKHTREAAAAGATIGQGFLFGHPAPLPSEMPPPTEAIPLRRAQTATPDATPGRSWPRPERPAGPPRTCASAPTWPPTTPCDDERRYDVVVTHDRELVIRAAEPLLRRLVPEH